MDHPPATTQSAAAPLPSRERGLSLRPRPHHSAAAEHCKDEWAVTESETGQTFPRRNPPAHSARTERRSPTAQRDRPAFTLRTSDSEQSSTVGRIESPGKDGPIVAPGLSAEDRSAFRKPTGSNQLSTIRTVHTSDKDRQITAHSGSDRLSTVRGVSTSDKDGSMLAADFSTCTTRVAASSSLEGRSGVRRRLGMTSRTSRHRAVSSRYLLADDVTVSLCPIEASVACTGSSIQEDHGSCSSLGRSPTRLDRSFTQLVEGLHGISPGPGDCGKTVAATEAQQVARGRRLRRSRDLPRQSHAGGRTRRGRSGSVDDGGVVCVDSGTPADTQQTEQIQSLQNPWNPREQTHASGRSRRSDHDRPGSRDDGGFIRVESGDVRALVKDCVVRLERSQCVEELVETTASRRVSETEIFSPTAAADESRKASPLSATPLPSTSVLLRAADRCDQPRSRLSLRKSPRSDSVSSSPLKSMASNNTSSDREMNLSADRLLVDNSTCVGSDCTRLAVPHCGMVVDSDSRLHASQDHSSTATHRRLKRRKVCLELTGSRSRDDGRGFDSGEVAECCIVGRNSAGPDNCTASEAVLGQTEVLSPRPDPDLSLSGCETSVCSTGAEKAVALNTDVLSQPDPDLVSVTRLKCARGTEAEVVQSDPDLSPSQSVVKCAETAIVTSSEAELGRSEARPQSDRDLPPLVHVTTVSDETLLGQPEVMLQSDPDRLRPDPDYSQHTRCEDVMGQPEVMLRSDPDYLQHAHCADVMYRLALLSSPETSDRDSSPPVPLSPSESSPGENQLTRRTCDNHVDATAAGYLLDVRQVVDAEVTGCSQWKAGTVVAAAAADAVQYLSDLKASAEACPEVTESTHSRPDDVRQTTDCSSAVFSLPSVSRTVSVLKNWRHEGEDFVQESGLAAEENVMVTCSDADGSSSQMDNLRLDLVRYVDVGRKVIDSTSASGGSLNIASSNHEQMNQSETAILEVSENADFQKSGDNVGSAPFIEKSCVSVVDCGMEGSLNESGNAISDSVDIDDVQKNNISSVPSRSRSFDEFATPTVEDLVVFHPESLPPSRHQVLFDLASSSRSSLLQSSRDAFCSDAGDFPSHPRYAVMLGIHHIKRDIGIYYGRWAEMFFSAVAAMMSLIFCLSLDTC